MEISGFSLPLRFYMKSIFSHFEAPKAVAYITIQKSQSGCPGLYNYSNLSNIDSNLLISRLGWHRVGRSDRN